MSRAGEFFLTEIQPSVVESLRAFGLSSMRVVLGICFEGGLLKMRLPSESSECLGLNCSFPLDLLTCLCLDESLLPPSLALVEGSDTDFPWVAKPVLDFLHSGVFSGSHGSRVVQGLKTSKVIFNSKICMQTFVSFSLV